PDVVRRKVGRAVTDSDVGATAVRSDREAKPGVTNLLEILRSCGGSADGASTYGALKASVTDAVVAVLEPLQASYADLAADPEHVRAVFEAGAERCREVSGPLLDAATAASGWCDNLC
ncbi:MAG: tryptophan--tRNA ligase, partial [Nocardioides sp.]